MQLKFKVTKSFFDAPKIQRRVDFAKKRNFSRMGAFIRTRARSSLRRRKRTAAVGSPPSVHSKGTNLKTIFFFYDLAKETMVVGPVEFRGRQSDRTASNIHEFGGKARMRKTRRTGKKRVNNYPKRPFMGPALEAEVEAGIVPKVWADSVTE